MNKESTRRDGFHDEIIMWFLEAMHEETYLSARLHKSKYEKRTIWKIQNEHLMRPGN